MPRQPEYDRLLRIGTFKEAASSPDSIVQFLRTADDMLAATAQPIPDSARFILAYEGMFSVVMAVLEHHEVRPGDSGGHRVTAIQRVASDLKLTAAKQSALGRLHDDCMTLGLGESLSRRCAWIRRAPIPSAGDAKARGAGGIHRGFRGALRLDCR